MNNITYELLIDMLNHSYGLEQEEAISLLYSNPELDLCEYVQIYFGLD